MESIVKATLNSDIESLKKLLDDHQVPKKPLCYSKFALDFQLDDIKKVYLHEKSTGRSDIDFENQRQKFLKLLLDNGACSTSGTAENDEGWSKTGLEFLVFTCKFVNQEIVKTIFNFGANFVSKDKWSLVKILEALKSGKKEIYNLLLDRVDAATINRLGLLHLYVKSGNATEEIVLKFIQLGAVLNCVDEERRKVLDIAIEVGKLNIIEVLIENKAETSQIMLNDGDGLKVLKLALSSGNLKIVEFLLKQGAKTCKVFRCLFLDAFKDDNIEMLQLLLKYYGADNDENMSFLTVHAVQRGNEKIVQLMLDQEELLDEERLTSLLFEAMKFQNPGVVKLLLDRGADANGFDPWPMSGCTALYTAVTFRQKEIVKLLFDYGADVKQELGRSNMLLLHRAVQWHDKEIIELLLSQGVFINKIDIINKTGLTVAIDEMVDKQIVRLLLDYGADISKRIECFGPALIFTISNDHCGYIVQLLLDYGRDVNDVFKGMTALTISIQYGFSEVSKILVRHIALMKTKKLFVSKMNFNAIKENNELNKFKNKCSKEIKSLKGKQFADSVYFYFDVLKIQDIRKLSPLANSRSIVKTVKSINFKEKFPIYGEVIEDRIDKGISVNKDFELLKKFINYLSARSHDKLPKLPFTFVKELFNYLKYADIAKLKYL